MRYGLETPLRLVKPITCHWCGGNMRLLRHTFKGQDSSHEYCSENCLKRGLDREIRYKATLAGRVNSPWHLALAGILLLFVIGFIGTPKARAHDPSTHQADPLSEAKSEAFGVCCSGDDYVRVSTWETTDTGYRVLYKGKWWEFSRRVKVNNMTNPDGEAKIWINGTPEAPYVRCFMPGAQI